MERCINYDYKQKSPEDLRLEQEIEECRASTGCIRLLTERRKHSENYDISSPFTAFVSILSIASKQDNNCTKKRFL